MNKFKQYAITLTYKCNWSCSYCAVRNTVDWKPSVTLEDIKQKIDVIEDYSVVTLFGGEPGILDEDVLRYIITKLTQDKHCKLKLETNGLFIKRFPQLIHNFETITYHCSEDLDETDTILECNHPNVVYMIIIHDNNINKLGRFLETHKSPEKFYAVEATYPHEITGPTLSKPNKNILLARFGGRLTKDAIHRLIYGFDFSNIIFLT